MSNAWIVDAARTPRGRGKKDKGALSGIHPQELMAQTLNALAKKTSVDTTAIEDVVLGTVVQAQEQGACIARRRGPRRARSVRAPLAEERGGRDRSGPLLEGALRRGGSGDRQDRTEHRRVSARRHDVRRARAAQAGLRAARRDAGGPERRD